MVGTVDSIQKELKALESATEDMADDLRRLYQDYLEQLGEAVRRQLILASYQLCTQAYPEAFLRLSVSQRESLQQALKKLGEQAQNRFANLLNSSGPEETQVTRAQVEALLETQASASEADAKRNNPSDTPKAASDDSVFSLQALDQRSTDQGNDREPSDDQGSSEAKSQGSSEAKSNVNSSEQGQAAEMDDPMMRAMLMSAVMEAIEASRASEEDDTLTPDRLARRFLRLERQIRTMLQGLSKSANFFLQEAKVLPNLPDAVLTAAAEADLPVEKVTNTPNLLNVLVEMANDNDNEDEDKDDSSGGDSESSSEKTPRSMAHLVAISLRLSDIEFAETHLSMERNRLRKGLERLKRLASQYQKKQRALSIAEAEAAWRSLWYD